MRPIMFSRVFPAYHPRKGEQTRFVEKIVKGLDMPNFKVDKDLFRFFNFAVYSDCTPKYHTIRAGNRWKVGDVFSPRIWTDKPYRSKQVQFAPPIEIKKVWDLDFNLISRPFYTHRNELGHKVSYGSDFSKCLAVNDGFSNTDDLEEWLLAGTPIYNPCFSGQIICWNENINY